MKNTKLNISKIHHLFLWVYNWKKEDFEKAFEKSPLEKNYQWKKFQNNLTGDKCSSAAIIETILNMDNLHQELLFDYILNVKYKGAIKSMEENIKFMKNWKPSENE